MADTKPPMHVELEWLGEEHFSCRTGSVGMTIDGNGQAHPSPMQVVAFGLAGCMGTDLAIILTKGRHPLQKLAAALVAHRAAGTPARFTAFDLHYRVTGDVPEDAVVRAIDLSREKYCSVWHSLRQDITLSVTYEIVR